MKKNSAGPDVEKNGWLKFGDNIDLVIRILLAAVVGIGIYWVLKPFLTAILIAAILAVVSWPIHARVRRWCGNGTTLPASIMVGALVILVLIPVSLALISVAQRIPAIIHWVRGWIHAGFPIPEWILSLPYVGPWLASGQITTIDMSQLGPTIQKIVEPASSWILNATLNVGQGLIQIALVAFVVFFFYRDGLWFAERARLIMRRLSGSLSTELTGILVNTTRSVIFGLIGTAIGQGVVAGIGFWMTGVPRPILLGTLVTFLSIIPVGPPLVWIPAAAWLFATGQTAQAVILAFWGLLVVSSIDNFLKPVLISRGTSLPISLIFLGVFGGVFAFGFMGLILGPVLLAVGVAMLKAWTDSNLETTGQAAPAEGTDGEPESREQPAEAPAEGSSDTTLKIP